MEVREASARYMRMPQRHLTELGELPFDWQVVSIGGFRPFVTSGSRGWAAYYSESGATFLRITNLSRSRIYPSLDDLRYVAVPADNSEGIRTALQVGDVLISITADIGIIGLVTPAIELPAYINQHIALVRVGSEQVDSRYLAYFLAGTASQRRFKAMTDAGAKAGMNLAGVRQVVAAFPPTTTEQKAIAEALSDADALIESLSLLLAKKCWIKQGAMQELLTGRRRLPGFADNWASCLLGDVIEHCSSGATPYRGRDDYYKGTVKWITSGELNYNVIFETLEHISDEARRATNLRLHPPGTFLMAITGLEAAGTRGACGIVGAAATTNQSCMAIYPTPALLTQYLYYYYVFRGNELALSYCQGTKQQSYTARLVKLLPIEMPSDVNEQAAIVEVLSEIDADIAALESKLNKAHRLKQGMMQELVTGRIRLVPQASSLIPFPGKNAETKSSSKALAHNWQINEAVVIGVLAQRFGTVKFPLPRKRRVKLMYLLHRHAEGRAEGYLKKAAGPYDPNTKYKGPEAIALKNGYVLALHNGIYEGFVAGAKAEQALSYFEQWYGASALDWLERFHYRKTDELELLATVDMATVDLSASRQRADLAGVKRLIAAHPEWVPKLSRELFSDDNIASAIAECRALFAD